ncbi:MAG: hypothetical protein NTW32_09840 [Chloroflexi bacterium]|nr:hypothetical protein [Chloroflexota bacterium]
MITSWDGTCDAVAETVGVRVAVAVAEAVAVFVAVPVAVVVAEDVAVFVGADVCVSVSTTEGRAKGPAAAGWLIKERISKKIININPAEIRRDKVLPFRN